MKALNHLGRLVLAHPVRTLAQTALAICCICFIFANPVCLIVKSGEGSILLSWTGLIYTMAFLIYIYRVVRPDQGSQIITPGDTGIGHVYDPPEHDLRWFARFVMFFCHLIFFGITIWGAVSSIIFDEPNITAANAALIIASWICILLTAFGAVFADPWLQKLFPSIATDDPLLEED